MAKRNDRTSAKPALLKISPERNIKRTVEAVISGLLEFNVQQMGKQKHKRFAVSLRNGNQVVGGVEKRIPYRVKLKLNPDL